MLKLWLIFTREEFDVSVELQLRVMLRQVRRRDMVQLSLCHLQHGDWDGTQTLRCHSPNAETPGAIEPHEDEVGAKQPPLMGYKASNL